MSEYTAALGLGLGFEYPEQYMDLVSIPSSLSNTSWWLIGNTKGFFAATYKLVNEQCNSSKLLIPFAKNDETNLLACFDQSGKIYFYKSGTNLERNDWDGIFHFKSFNEFFKAVQAGSI